MGQRIKDRCTKCQRLKAEEPGAFLTVRRGGKQYLSSRCRPCQAERRKAWAQRLTASRSCDFEGCGRPYCRNGLCFTHAKQRDDGMPLSPIRGWRIRHERDRQGRKLCIGCEVWLPEDSFGRNEKNSDGFGTYCRPCMRDRQRERSYGIPGQRYRELLAAQGGVCAVCRGVCGTGRDLAVDHDHACCPGDKSCGKCVRGLLCGNCNMGIGLLKEDPVRLEAAIGYLAAARSNASA